MLIELRDYNSAARNPVTKQIMRDKSGKQIPKFPDLRGVFVDGVDSGLCTARPNMPLILTVTYPPHVQKLIAAEVEEKLGHKLRTVSSIPAMESIEEEDE